MFFLTALVAVVRIPAPFAPLVSMALFKEEFYGLVGIRDELDESPAQFWSPYRNNNKKASIQSSTFNDWMTPPKMATVQRFCISFAYSGGGGNTPGLIL